MLPGLLRNFIKSTDMIRLFRSPLRRRIEKKIERLRNEREEASRKVDGKILRRVHHIDIQIKVLKEML